MLKRFLACLLILCLLCPVALGESGSADDWLAGLLEQMNKPQETEAPFAGGVLLPGDDGISASLADGKSTVPGNPGLLRSKVVGIRFESSLAGAPEGAWDMSAAGDRSVLAWTVELDNGLCAMFIAADGTVRANPDASHLFALYNSLMSIDFNNSFDTVGVTDMSWMFFRSFERDMDATLDLSCFDTSSVTTMYCMFSGSRIKHVNLSSFDTSKVTDMAGMFFSASSLRSVDVSSFDTSRVVSAFSIFARCDKLTSLDLSSWDLSKVEDVHGMFSYASSLESLIMNEVNPAADQTDMFEGCDSLPDEIIAAHTVSQSPILPDPHYFFHEKLEHAEGGYYCRFDFHHDAAQAAKEYVDLLSSDSRFNLQLRTTMSFTDNWGDGVETLYLFDYTGTVSVDDIGTESVVTKKPYYAPVIVETLDWIDGIFQGTITFRVYWSADFTFVDTGDRSSVKTFIDKSWFDEGKGVLGPVGSYEGNGSNSSSSGGTNEEITVAPFVTTAPRKCSICNGTGWRTCLTCNGLGTVTSSGSKKLCPNSFCVGGKVKCTTCGGTGWN